MVYFQSKNLILTLVLSFTILTLQAQEHDLSEDIMRRNLDTVATVKTFYPVDHKKSRILTDTAYSIYHLQYDPARRGNRVGNLNASYLGSEVFQTYYAPRFSLGFDVGHHIYDYYKVNVDTAALYKSRRAFSDLLYAQGSSQNQGQTEAKFGTHFGEQYLSVGYKRVNNTGNYQNQESIHTSLYVGYHLNEKQFDLSLIFGSNVIQDKYNGGIVTDTLYGEGLSSALLNIPILLNAAQARHQNKQYLGQWDYKFDWFPLFDQFSLYSKWSDSYVKVFDTQPNPEFYGEYYIDDVGLRQFIRWKKWENKVSLSNSFSDASSYEVGLQYNYVNLYQEPVRNKFSEIYGFGNFTWSIAKSLEIEGDAKFGLQNDIFEWEFGGDLQWTSDQVELSGTYRTSSTLPDLIEQKMFLRQERLYDAGLQPILRNTLGGSLHIPLLKLSAATHYHNITNYRFWSQGDLEPSITSFNLLQMSLNYHLQLGVFHLDNILEWQIVDRDKLPVPEWQGRHQLYLDSEIFSRNMHLKAGFEGRYYLNYTPAFYQPFYGQFFVGNETRFESVPYLLDFFAGFRVQTFYLFLRLENIPTLFGVDRFYSHYQQPYSDFGFRIGIRWRLNG